MDDVRKARVREALKTLTDDPSFRAMAAGSSDERFDAFRHGVELVELRSLARPPADAPLEEIRNRLEALRALCTGRLSGFGTFLDAAMAQLGAGASR